MSQQRNGSSPNAVLSAGGPILTSAGRDLLANSIELKPPTSVLHYAPTYNLYGQQLLPQPSISPSGGTYAQMLALPPAVTGVSTSPTAPVQKQEYKDFPATTQLASPGNSSSASGSAENASFSGASSPGAVPVPLSAVPVSTPGAHQPGAGPPGPFKPASGAMNGPSAPYVRVRTTPFFCFLSLVFSNISSLLYNSSHPPILYSVTCSSFPKSLVLQSAVPVHHRLAQSIHCSCAMSRAAQGGADQATDERVHGLVARPAA